MTDTERSRIVELQHQGYGYKKISAITGLPLNTVKSFCARHPVPIKELPGSNALCRNCLTPLEQTPHKRKRLFCSDACRMTWWNAHPERVQRKAYYTLTCRYCGKQFECFTVDFLTKKRKVNEGEVPQYYVEHSHEPIITPEEFDKVQTELARRKRISRQYSGKSIFSSRIVCGDCGSYFGSKAWNSTSKYRRVIWQCNGKFKGEHKCETPHLDEETIKARFVVALNAIIDSKDNILEDCRLMQTTLTDCTGIDAEIESLLEEIQVVAELTKRCIAENSQTAQNQNEYAARYNGFVERYEKAKAQLEQLRTTKAAREAQADAIGAFMFEV